MSDVLGSAAWNTHPGYWRYAPIGNAGTPVQGGFLLLGESQVPGHLHVCPPLQHLISVAPTRSGKGVSLIIPNLLTYRGAVLVVDPKAENAWISAAHRRQAFGQKTVIVDPWNEVNKRYGSLAGDLETIARFNPLSILDPESDEYADDVASLADALIITESSKDPYWDNSARELVAGLIAFLIESPEYRAHASLGFVRDLVCRPASYIRAIVEASQRLPDSGVAKRKLAAFEADTDAISSIISNARTQTAFLDSPTLKRNMEASDFSFDELCGGNISIYLVLPPDKLETCARWLRLMVTIGIRAVARGGSRSRSGLPALFVLDEFGTIGKLNAVAHAYGLMAGLGMTMWAFVQDLNQLKRDYPDHWETFIGNAQAMTSFGTMDNFTAEYISHMLGTSTVEQVNVSTSVGKSVAPYAPGGPIWASRRTSIQTSTSTSTQVMSRPLMHPDEIRGLNSELCVIVGRFAPIMSRRMVFHRDWRLLHCARPNPQFPRTENVRWLALQHRLFDAGSVAGLLAQEGYQVKALRRGRWEVRPTGTGKAAHSFANDTELWRWAYVLVMDGADSARALPSAV